MFRVTRALRLAAGFIVVLGGLIIASCSGGSVQTTPLSSATTAPVTQAIPPGGGTLTFATSATNVAQLTFAAGVASGVSITANSSTTAPAGAPAVTSLKRAAEANVVGGVPFFYVTFSVSATVSSALLAGESVTLSGQPATATYGVEFADITSSPATALGDAGPGTPVNNVVTIVNGTSTNSPSLLAGHTYLMMFFYVPAGTVQASPSPTASASASASPSAQPSATASAIVLGSQMTSGGTLTLPSLNSGAYTGTMPSSTFAGLGSQTYTMTYGNYNFTATGAPTPPPNSGTVYAKVSFLINTSGDGSQSWSGTASNMSLTVPTVAGKSSVTVRMWEAPSPLPAICLNSTGGAALTVTPGTGGLLSFVTPLQGNIASGTGLTACNAGGANPNDPNINPLFGTNAGVWIMVTDS